MAADGCRREKARPINHNDEGYHYWGICMLDTIIS